MSDDSRRSERGFTFIEVIVVLALVGATLLALGSVRALHPPHAHATALQFQAALAHARALAMANAGLANADRTSTGATLSVTPGARGSIIRIFRARPIPGYAAPVPDRALPPIVVPARLGIVGKGDAGSRFSVLVSSSGDASIALGYAFDPARPSTIPTDPGCDEAVGVRIEAVVPPEIEAHPFACRNAAYDANG